VLVGLVPHPQLLGLNEHFCWNISSTLESIFAPGKETPLPLHQKAATDSS